MTTLHDWTDEFDLVPTALSETIDGIEYTPIVVYEGCFYALSECTETTRDGFIPNDVIDDYYHTTNTGALLHVEECTWCEREGEYYDECDVTFSEHDDQYYPDDADYIVDLFHGGICHQNNATYCPYYDAYFTEYETQDMSWSDAANSYLMDGDANYCEECDDTFPHDMECNCGNHVPEGMESRAYKKANIHEVRKPDVHTEQMIGVELEYELQHASRFAVADVLNKYIPELGDLKGDASLRNGQELAVAPHGLRAFFDAPWEPVLNELRALGCDADTCRRAGLHVHVTRPQGVDRDRLVQQLVGYFTRNQDWLLRFSDRNEEQLRYCRLHSPDSHRWYEEKYSAVNFLHRNTVEFRLWNGTLHYDRFRASIEFSHAIMQFLFVGALEDPDVETYEHNTFMEWLTSGAYHEDYSHLINYINAKGM